MRTRMMLVAALALAACADDDDSTATALDASTPFDANAPAPVDATAADASIDATTPVVVTPSDCFLNPNTYLEIINACTDAEKVDKKPVLPLLGSDGKLPPLP
jgi:type IV pilus biogenesis protein CpaD/CtpE